MQMRILPPAPEGPEPHPVPEGPALPARRHYLIRQLFPVSLAESNWPHPHTGQKDPPQRHSASSRDSDYNNIILAPITPKVALAVFTTTIRKRYPANDIAVLDNPH